MTDDHGDEMDDRADEDQFMGFNNLWLKVRSQMAVCGPDWRFTENKGASKRYSIAHATPMQNLHEMTHPY